MKIPNIAAVSKLEAAFSYGAKKSGEIKNFTEMDRRKIQMEMVAESMNDDFSHHLSAEIGCLVRETVKEVVAEMEACRWASRDKLLQTIADIGGFPQKGVNKSTQILVVGQQDYRRVGEDGMSRKQEKAMELKDAGQDIEVMSEEQFLSMLGVELDK